MVGLKTLHGVDQHAVISIAGRTNDLSQITFVVKTLGQFRHAFVFHGRAQQRPAAHRLPLRQGFEPLRSVELTQVLILRQARSGQFERGGNVVHARYRDGQQFRLTVAWGGVGMPQRFEV
ncbi:hypothetical protein D3C81_1090480 [compost metagenome]